MSRRSRDELRQLMVDAGGELLRRRGLSFDPPSLTYANVFQYLDDTRNIRLHRSQVHGRIWESQDHYRADVVIETIRNVLPASDEVDELVTELAEDVGVGDLRSLIEGWMAAAVGARRAGANQDLGVDLFVAAQALAQSGSETVKRVSDAAAQNLNERMRRNERRYDAIVTSLDVEFVRHLDMDRCDAIQLLARNSSALVEGVRMMESLDGSEPETFYPLDKGGERQGIDAATLGLIVFAEQLFDLGG